MVRLLTLLFVGFLHFLVLLCAENRSKLIQFLATICVKRMCNYGANIR